MEACKRLIFSMRSCVCGKGWRGFLGIFYSMSRLQYLEKVGLLSYPPRMAFRLFVYKSS